MACGHANVPTGWACALCYCRTTCHRRGHPVHGTGSLCNACGMRLLRQNSGAQSASTAARAKSSTGSKRSNPAAPQRQAPQQMLAQQMLALPAGAAVMAGALEAHGHKLVPAEGGERKVPKHSPSHSLATDVALTLTQRSGRIKRPSAKRTLPDLQPAAPTSLPRPKSPKPSLPELPPARAAADAQPPRPQSAAAALGAQTAGACAAMQGQSVARSASAKPVLNAELPEGLVPKRAKRGAKPGGSTSAPKPAVIVDCARCGLTRTPMKRHHPSYGDKDLCNACGVSLRRLGAKAPLPGQGTRHGKARDSSNAGCSTVPAAAASGKASGNVLSMPPPTDVEVQVAHATLACGAGAGGSSAASAPKQRDKKFHVLAALLQPEPTVQAPAQAVPVATRADGRDANDRVVDSTKYARLYGFEPGAVATLAPAQRSELADASLPPGKKARKLHARQAREAVVEAQAARHVLDRAAAHAQLASMHAAEGAGGDSSLAPRLHAAGLVHAQDACAHDGSDCSPGSSGQATAASDVTQFDISPRSQQCAGCSSPSESADIAISHQSSDAQAYAAAQVLMALQNCIVPKARVPATQADFELAIAQPALSPRAVQPSSAEQLPHGGGRAAMRRGQALCCACLQRPAHDGLSCQCAIFLTLQLGNHLAA